MGTELFHGDRQTDGWTGGRKDIQTDMTKPRVPFFCKFATTPKKDVIKTMSRKGESKKSDNL